ncbi:MAG: GntR family transcriptional regulator [Betaproteobacteria bacterium]|nr:MAG: GntR family transcriptional regulator [Betaproteobacteria bacterium]
MTSVIATGVSTGIPTGQPLYKEVKLRITRGLMDGEWRPGEAIPSEARLAERFHVSVGTVRKAIDELVAEKILLRQQGRGTFVAAHTLDRTLFYFFHLVGKDGRKETPETEMLAFTRGRADVSEASGLGIARSERVFRIRNLLRLSADPVVIDDIVIPAHLFPDLDEEVFGRREGTIYGLYQARYGINVIRIAERLSATLADADTGKLLDVPVGTPLLRIARIAYTYHGRPVELRHSLVDTTQHEYLSDLVKT